MQHDVAQRALASAGTPPATSFVDIVFTGPPGPEPPRFVEVEDTDGRSIRFGEWLQRDDHWALRIRTRF